jgi:hypothetical protein
MHLYASSTLAGKENEDSSWAAPTIGQPVQQITYNFQLHLVFDEPYTVLSAILSAPIIYSVSFSLTIKE